jgi:hypothetical protein
MANAKPGPVDPEKVQALAVQIEAALSNSGGAGGGGGGGGGGECGASVSANVATIQSTIAASGADPAVAMAALHVAQSSPSLCPNAKPAIASVDQTIADAVNGSETPAAGGPIGAGGPGGASPIGAPQSYSSGGGSDYLAR